LSQCGVGIGATGVGLIRDSSRGRRFDRPGPSLECFGFLARLLGIVVDQRIERCVGWNQGGVGHHTALLSDQTVFCATLHDLAKDRLVNLFSIPVPDATERRVVRHVIFQREPAEPAVDEIEVDFITQTSVLIDAVQIRHQHHPEVDDRVDRRPSLSVHIARGGQFSDERRFDDPVDLPEQVVLRDERLQINDRPGFGLKDMQSLHERPPWRETGVL